MTSADFSYAAPQDGAVKRLAIRAIEQFSGQPRLKRLYLEYARAPKPRADFWSAAIEKLDLTIKIDRGNLGALPAEGPLIVVANHPFGVLDGIVLSHLVGTRRSDFRILVNSVLTRAPEASAWLLPIDFADTDAARRVSAKSRSEARNWLDKGGALIAFPGGTVSTAPTPFGRAVDPYWQPFVGALALRTHAAVVPVYFDGENSRLFQIASHFSQALRLALLFHEVARRIGTEIHLSVGETIFAAELARLGDRKAVVAYLREATYALGGRTDTAPSAKLAAIAARRSGPCRTATLDRARP